MMAFLSGSEKNRKWMKWSVVALTVITASTLFGQSAFASGGAIDEDLAQLRVQEVVLTEEIQTRRQTGVVVVPYVFIHEEPTGTSGHVGYVLENRNVRIVAVVGDWTQIIYDGMTGWILSDTVARTVVHGVVTDSDVAVHQRASSESEVLTTATTGQRVTVTHRTNRWARVRVNGYVGWMRLNQMSFTGGGHPGHMDKTTYLRATPSWDGAVVDTLGEGQAVVMRQRTINGEEDNQGWTQVLVVDAANTTRSGWVRTADVNRGNQQRVVGGSNTVPLRTGPGGDYDRIQTFGRLNRNTPVAVLATASNWSYVRVTVADVHHYGWTHNRNVLPIHAMHLEIEQRLTQLHRNNPNIGISYFCLTTGRHLSFNGDQRFFAASTIKLSAHMLVAEAIHRGELDWENVVTITEADMIGSADSGVLPDSGVGPGSQMRMFDLLWYSVRYSDNLAFTALMRQALPHATHFGMYFTDAVHERFLPGATSTGRHRISPNEQTEILRQLYMGRHEIQGYNYIIDFMRNTPWNWRFNTDLTTNHVAHIPGWTMPYQNDSGIFFTNNPYILVVYTRGVGGEPFLTEVSEAVFNINIQY